MQVERAARCAAQSKSSGSRRWWWLGALVLVGAAALYAGWGWLAATGLSAIILAVAPCLAMCALGLCMGRGKREAHDDRA